MYNGIIMQKAIHKRVNITLPKDTIHLIDRVTEKGDRSRFLDAAVRFYVQELGRAHVRKLLREGAVKRGTRDLALTQEWFCLEHEVWQREQKQ